MNVLRTRPGDGMEGDTYEDGCTSTPPLGRQGDGGVPDPVPPSSAGACLNAWESRSLMSMLLQKQHLPW